MFETLQYLKVLIRQKTNVSEKRTNTIGRIFLGFTQSIVLDKGVRKLAPEMCIPMKIYTGHVIELLESGVDYIYIPRFVSIAENDAFCPKFMGLPDLLASILPDLKDKIITHSIISESEDIANENNYIYLAEKFNIDKRKICEALKIARKKWLTYRNLCSIQSYNSRERTIKCCDLKLSVVGYVYDIYDEFISMDILEKLSELGSEKRSLIVNQKWIIHCGLISVEVNTGC